MKTTFTTLKNGNVAVTVWANPTTKEIYPANQNSFGINAICHIGDDFYNKYGKNLKTNQNKGNFRVFSYSAKAMESVGFILVKRGTTPLW